MGKVIWTPQPKQLEFMRRFEDEALYGGAAGGGKSDAMVMEALRQVDIPYYRGLILRRTFPQLEDLIEKTRRYYPKIYPGAKYNGGNHTWRFPSGAVVIFGSMQHEHDKFNYQGKPYDFIGFDELTQFTFSQYDYLVHSRNRPNGPGTRVYYPSLQGASELILSSTEKVKSYTGIKIDQSSGALTFEGETDKTGANLKPDDVLKVDGQADRFRVVVSTSRKGNNITVSYREYMVKQQKVPPFTDVFSVNQAVEITGSSIEANNKTAIIRKVEENKLTFYEKTFSTGSESGTVNIKRNVPDLTVVCESDNRIWGADQTTIWASALGDPAAWYTYDGLSTDSFSVAVGTDGAFTGCIAYGSNVLFFKENHLHKVLGSFPAEYRIYTYNIPGVQEGSNKSLCVINEVLFYKGISGVYSYTGSTPVLISENFGLRLFDQAHAGADVDRYYISMRDSSNGLWNLFVFDTVRAIWLREDDSHAVDFAWLEGQLYMMDADAKKIVLLNQDDGQEVRFPWSAEFAPLDDNSYGKRGYSRLYLYLELDPGAWVRLDKREDNGPWQQVRTWSAENAMSVTAGVMPGRCSRFQIRLSGNGRCVVKNFVREFDVGGDK